MTLPIPKKNEKYKKFAGRFLKSSEVKKKYPKIRERFTAMSEMWGKHKQHDNISWIGKNEKERMRNTRERDEFWRTH